MGAHQRAAAPFRGRYARRSRRRGRRPARHSETPRMDANADGSRRRRSYRRLIDCLTRRRRAAPIGEQDISRSVRRHRCPSVHQLPLLAEPGHEMTVDIGREQRFVDRCADFRLFDDLRRDWFDGDDLVRLCHHEAASRRPFVAGVRHPACPCRTGPLRSGQRLTISATLPIMLVPITVITGWFGSTSCMALAA